MKSIWKSLALGATVMFLLQSCVTVRSPRHRHHPHRHCMVTVWPVIDTTLLNLSPAGCLVASEPTVYGNKG